MKIVDEWRWLVKKAWSVRLIMLAGLLSGLEVCFSVLSAYQVDTGVPPGTFAALSGLVTIAAFLARFVAQSRD